MGKRKSRILNAGVLAVLLNSLSFGSMLAQDDGVGTAADGSSGTDVSRGADAGSRGADTGSIGTDSSRNGANGSRGATDVSSGTVGGADDVSARWTELMKVADEANDARDYLSANDAYNQALAIAEKFGDKDQRLWTTLRKVGTTATALKKYDEANSALRRALKLSEPDKSQDGLLAQVASHYGIAKLLQQKDQYAEAIGECKVALDLLSAEENKTPAIQLRIQALRREIMLMRVQESAANRPDGSAAAFGDDGLSSTGNGAGSSTPGFGSGFGGSSGDPSVQSGDDARIAQAAPSQPLLGGVSESTVDQLTNITGFKSDIPKMDGSDPRFHHELPKLPAHLTKLQEQVSKMLTEYGTVGLFLTKVIVTPAVVAHTLSGGSAQAVGLMKGDAIISIDGQPTNRMDMTQLHFLLTGKPGEVRQLVVQRGGQRSNVSLPLWSVYQFKDPVSMYIEYYWFLLYNNFITPDQYKKLAAPYEKVLEQ